MKIVIGSDHAGFFLKENIKNHLEKKGLEVTDLGPEEALGCDYSVKALEAGRAVVQGRAERGILICGTGLGMSMAANRIKGVRAALCTNEYLAKMSRAHNNANILALGERVIGPGLALAIVDAWLETEFEGGRHQRRIDIFDEAD
ncbi:MAG: ribose 5-phosphate isomerase B [Pseudomonadota bacterium]